MLTWFNKGEDDALRANRTLPLATDRIKYAREGYAWWCHWGVEKKSVQSYREYLKGFTSVLPFKDNEYPPSIYLSK